MNPISRAVLPLVVAAAAVGPASVAIAQSEPTRAGMVQTPELIDVSFAGGTMAEYVEAIRAAVAPEPLNVLLRNEAAELTVPEIRLRSVSIKTAFEIAVPRRGRWTEQFGDGTTVQHFLDLERLGDAYSAPVYIVDASTTVERQTRAADGPSRPTAAIEVFSIQEAASDEKGVRDLLSAIDTALALDESSAETAEVKYHADSSLIIVRGSRDQISTIHQVVQRFSESGITRQNEQLERAARIADLKAELIERRADVRQAEVHLSTKLTELQQLRVLADKDIYNPRQILEAETAVRLIESEVEAARARYLAAQEKLSMFADSAEPPATEQHELQIYGDERRLQAAAELAHAIDSISGHITAVEASAPAKQTVRGKTDLVITLKVQADREGVDALRMALSGRIGAILDTGD